MSDKPEIKFNQVNQGEVYMHKHCRAVFIDHDVDERYCKGSQAISRGGGVFTRDEERSSWIAKSNLLSRM